MLARLKARDRDTITLLIQENTDVLLHAAWGLGWSGPEAEEVVQDTFVGFLDSLDRFEGRSKVRTYLFGILYHKTQQKRREREIPSDPIDEVFEKRFGFGGIWQTMPRGPEEEALAGETALLLQECLENLPTNQRMAFYLKEVDHADAKTICNILEVSETNLRVLLFRARNRLRECVQRKWNAGT